MGLTSTSFIVTIQGAVSREQRGSATAANMFMRNFGNTVGAAIFGAVLNGTLMSFFREKNLDYEVNDINLLLTEESRTTLTDSKMNVLTTSARCIIAMGVCGCLMFAVISLLLILRIPRGKVVLHDNN